MAKKKIGIPVYRLGPNSLGVTNPYLEFISNFGRPVLLHPEDPVRTDLDLLILPGGPDVDPNRYGATPEVFTQYPSVFLEWFDKIKLPKYIENGTPIFGIN